VGGLACEILYEVTLLQDGCLSMLSRPQRTGLGRVAIVVAGLFAAHAAPRDDRALGPVSAAAQQTVTTGRLAAIWEDPLPDRGTPRLRHFLSGDDGELIPLRVTDSQLQFVGGPLAANGRYVEVSGSWRGRRTTPGATADRELQVSSVRYSAAPPGASAPPPQGAPIMGSHPWITVMCRFADSPTIPPHPLSWYQELMGSTWPGVDHYWRELSFDQANVAGSGALGWYDLPQPRSYYVDDDAGTANLSLLKNECAAVADADIYFPDFVGINFQFNESLGNFSWGGGSTLVIDGQAKFYRVTWLAAWADHVTYTHEMGHGFGLPHSSGPYGQVYDSNWDVMSGSWTNRDSFWGWLAPHTISYHKNMLGWIPAGRIYDATLGSSQTITLHRLNDLGAGGDYLMARVPLADGTYYTVEARRFVGYDESLPAEAVIMHHVTNRAFLVDPDNDGNPDDDGPPWLPGETFSDPTNGITVTIDSQTAEGFVVTIAVIDPGHIVLDPTTLNFEAQQGIDPEDQIFTISNTGTGDLHWTASEGEMWLELPATSGTTPSGGSTDITLSVVSQDLAPGNYSADITVSGNADNNPQVVTVNLDVTASPVITLIAEPLDIETVVGVDPPVHEIVIRNDGGAELNWTAASDVAWMTFSLGSGTLAAGASETDTIFISVAGLDVDTYTGTVTVSGDAPNSPLTLDATLNVTLSPSIALDPTTLEFVFREGDDPDDLSFQVANDGAGTLSWTAAVDSAWLTLSATSGDLVSGSDESVAVSVDGSGLAVGTHTATVAVSGNADDSPQTIGVQVTVEARPTMAAEDVADHLLGVRTTLSADELEYLDEIGNDNGGFDVGDFRAWLQSEGLMSRVRPAGGGEVAP